jgi:hypothetical protein
MKSESENNMHNEILKRFISFNKSFFSKNNKRDGGSILVDLQVTDIFIASLVMKISKAVSNVLDMDLIVISAIRAKGDMIDIIKSYNPLEIISARNLFISGFVSNFHKIIKLAMKMKSGCDLVSLEIEGMPVGMHIYDLILRRMGASTINRISLRQRFYMAAELSFFYAILSYINQHTISYAILADNVYRQGLVFEILKKKNIPSISGIDINGISMHKYESEEDYLQHCRAPDMDVVDKMMNTREIYSDVEKYLSHRTSGQEQQHDLVRAYSKDKMKIDRLGLINTYNLHPDKKIVLIMAHIFCDAPHAYPNMLFKDYEDWLIKTCRRLAKNSHVSFLVKEHPSVALYNEEGKIDSILNKIGLGDKLLSKKINTKSLFDSIDVVVTCGGTAGMEFPCYGVPVLVAAKPPYASFPYIVSPDTETAYYSELDRIHEHEKLSDEKIRVAKCVLYVIHSVMKIEKDKIGLGSQQYLRGGDLDVDLFMKEMIADCDDGAGYSALVSAMERFLSGKHKNLIDLSKLDL